MAPREPRHTLSFASLHSNCLLSINRTADSDHLQRQATLDSNEKGPPCLLKDLLCLRGAHPLLSAQVYRPHTKYESTWLIQFDPGASINQVIKQTRKRPLTCRGALTGTRHLWPSQIARWSFSWFNEGRNVRGRRKKLGGKLQWNYLSKPKFCIAILNLQL